MKLTCLLLLAALSVWAQQAPAPTVSPDTVVLTVGNEKITQAQFEQILQTLPEAQRKSATTPQGRRQLAEQFAELKLLAQAARAKKMDQDPVMQLKIAITSEQVLAANMFQSMGSNVDDATLKAYYDEHKTEFETAKARHILITMKGSRAPARAGQKELTDAEALAKAKDLYAKLKAGASFADLAKAESDDTGTASQGGDLGEFGRGAMVKEFETAAFSQPLGEVGEPVKTQFGYHIILVEARSIKSLDSVRAQIMPKIGPELAKKGLDDLKKQTPPVLDEAYFGPPRPATGLAAPASAK